MPWGGDGKGRQAGPAGHGPVLSSLGLDCCGYWGLKSICAAALGQFPLWDHSSPALGSRLCPASLQVWVSLLTKLRQSVQEPPTDQVQKCRKTSEIIYDAFTA